MNEMVARRNYGGA